MQIVKQKVKLSDKTKFKAKSLKQRHRRSLHNNTRNNPIERNYKFIITYQHKLEIYKGKKGPELFLKILN